MAQNSELPSSSQSERESLQRYRGFLNQEDEDGSDDGFLRSLNIHHDFADGDSENERQQTAELWQTHSGSQQQKDLQTILSEQGKLLTRLAGNFLTWLRS